MQQGFCLGWKLCLQILKKYMSFYKPSTTWLHVSMFNTCLIWVLFGGLFTGKTERTIDNHKIFFMLNRCICASYPTCTSDAEGEIKKMCRRINPIKTIRRILIIILMLHQKSGVPCKTKYVCK